MAGICKFCGSADLEESDSACVDVKGVSYRFPIPDGYEKPVVCNHCTLTQDLEAYQKILVALQALVLSGEF
jgi:hypothetical protein